MRNAKTRIKSRQKLYGSLLFAILVVLGCAKPRQDEPVVVPPPVVGPGPGIPNLTDYLNLSKTGAWLSFEPDMTAFAEWSVRHPLNDPSQFQINVDLRDNGNGRFGGNIVIAYKDNNRTNFGWFKTGSGSNQVSYQNRDVGKPNSEFNQWFTWEGKRVFHGFFQDQWGAIVFVVDNGIDLGDGGGITNLSGQVFFKNFINSTAPQSTEKCWFIRIGPYDCRTFIGSDDNIATTSALYPTNGYKYLGRFSNLDRSKGFNQ
jgi:hypothetical protein